MITILGLGFVGLTTALGFAKKGFKTYGFDIDKNRLNELKQYNIPFFEPNLKEVLDETLHKSFFLDEEFEKSINDSEAIFICVGTPGKSDGSADLKYIIKAVDQVLEVDSKKFQVIITKSTVPPSTVSKEIIPYVNDKLSRLPNRQIGFASNPEFLREGHCWEDFINPDRIVIGIEDNKSKEILDTIYNPFNAPIHYVSYNTAEYIKYLSNTLLSTLISYSNEMAIVADKVGDIDIASAFKILHEDKRWFGEPAPMTQYVYPGCGYGGYCLPKDTMALAKISEKNGYQAKIIEANIETNEKIKPLLVEKITNEINPRDKIGILGLSFKPNSDDVRFTASKDVIDLLIEKGYENIIAYDPVANDEFKKFNPELNIDYIYDLDEIIEMSDVLVLVTAWQEFIEKKQIIKQKPLYDLRYAL